MLIDEVTVHISAGKGGDGAVAFFPGKKGPSGGDGGNGGNVYVQAKREVSNLNQYSMTRVFVAQDGQPGDTFTKKGQNGADITLYVPLHTEVTNLAKKMTTTIEKYDVPFLLCKGGIGGLGNERFKTATNQTPRHAGKGTRGEQFDFLFELKLIADIGLIGKPNAGKTTLLNLLTRAGAKTADYPFTTLEPNLGVFFGFVIADIPGLIEGASTGKGLGVRFLKHIEKVRSLYVCVAADSTDVVGEIGVVLKELESYDSSLMSKPRTVILTKLDLVEKAKVDALALAVEQAGYGKPLCISVVDDESIARLQSYISRSLSDRAVSDTSDR